MNTESQSSQPSLSIVSSATDPSKHAAAGIDHLKELQKLPAIILQPETKNWTLVPSTFPEFNNFYRL